MEKLSALQILRGYNVEVGIIGINEKDKANKSTLRWRWGYGKCQVYWWKMLEFGRKNEYDINNNFVELLILKFYDIM